MTREKELAAALEPFAKLANNIPDQARAEGIDAYEVVDEEFGVKLGVVTEDRSRHPSATRASGGEGGRSCGPALHIGR